MKPADNAGRRKLDAPARPPIRGGTSALEDFGCLRVACMDENILFATIQCDEP